ncbi:MAG TPA: PAS domain S-box protein [Trueperaceae bacterium]
MEKEFARQRQMSGDGSPAMSELEKVIEGLEEGVIAFNGEGELLLINNAALRLLNIDKETRTRHELHEQLGAWQVSDDRGEPLSDKERPIERVIRGETFDKRAYRYRNPEKNEERQLICASRALEEEPRVRLLLLHDVTAIREAREERDAARSEQELAELQFQTIFDANPAPTMILDLTSNTIQACNGGMPEITGYRVGELQGRDILAAGLFEDRELVEHVLASLANHHSVPKTAATVRRKGGERAYVLFAAKPISLRSGEGAVFTFVDVTEQREAEIRFTKAFRLAPVPAVMTTLGEDRVVDVNNTYLEEFGRDKESMIGRTLDELGFFASERDLNKAQQTLRKHGRYRALELRLRRGDGARIALGYAETLNLAGTTVALKMFSDITERKQTEEHLLHAIQAVMSDTTWFTRSFLDRLAEIRRGGDTRIEEVTVHLTRRERQVLERLAVGMATREICNDLDLSINTVRNYLTSLYQKLGVNSRAEAMIWARERGMGSV